eukprot:scaffold1353_cov161-Amphora_coffeaeformis.AAC.20
MYGSVFQQHKKRAQTLSQESLSIRIRQEGPRRSASREALLQVGDEGEDDAIVPKGHATIFSCFINLVNTIVGAGMLGLPGAFGGTGYVVGSVMICLGAAFSANGLVLLTKAARMARLPSSFYSVARAAVPEYTVLIDLAVALKCFGVATGYLITVGDCMVDALDHLILNGDEQHDHSWWITLVLTRQFWIVGALFTVLPISFFRTLDSLKTASAVAMIFVVFLAIGIVAYANGFADPCLDMIEDQVCVGDIEPFTSIPRSVSKLPIFIFSFTCHQNIFPVVNEIQDRSQTRLNAVIFLAIGFALLLFSTVALEGYFTFGSNVMGDVLLNYPETAIVTILRICIAILVALSYPLQLDPSRRCITSLIKVVQQWRRRGQLIRVFHRRESADVDSVMMKEGEPGELSALDSFLSQQNESEGKDHQFMSDDIFYTVTVTFLLLSFLVAMVVDDLGIVLAMVGATGSTLVSYILPGLLYVKIDPHMNATKVSAMIQLVAGCVIMPTALFFVISGGFHH